MLVVGRERGLTFVELIVATIILSGVVGGILASFRVGRRAANLASHRMEALGFAEEALEELKGKVWPEPNEYFRDGKHTERTNPDICELPDGGFKDIFGGKRRYMVTPATEGDYKIVTMRVSWSEP